MRQSRDPCPNSVRVDCPDMHLYLAGFDIALTAPPPYLTRDDPVLSDFISTRSRRSRFGDVRVEIELMPIADGFDVQDKTGRVFEASTSYSMTREGGTYRLRCPSAPDRPALWVVELTPATGNVHVAYGPRVIRPGPPPAIANPLVSPLGQPVMGLLLSRHDGVIIHTAGLLADGACYLFPGKCEAGKSTISRLLHAHTDGQVLSDDRMIVRKATQWHFHGCPPGEASTCSRSETPGDSHNFVAFGTPWPGDAGFAVNAGAPLRALLFLRKSDHNEIVPLSPVQALDRLMPVTSVPWFDADLTGRVLDFCDDLLTHVPAYEFSFTPDANACRAFEEFATEKQGLAQRCGERRGDGRLKEPNRRANGT